MLCYHGISSLKLTHYFSTQCFSDFSWQRDNINSFSKKNMSDNKSNSQCNPVELVWLAIPAFLLEFWFNKLLLQSLLRVSLHHTVAFPAYTFKLIQICLLTISKVPHDQAYYSNDFSSETLLFWISCLVPTFKSLLKCSYIISFNFSSLILLPYSNPPSCSFSNSQSSLL